MFCTCKCPSYNMYLIAKETPDSEQFLSLACRQKNARCSEQKEQAIFSQQFETD